MQGTYGELLREVNNENQDKRKGATSVILGCEAQVEFQPNQEPFIGCEPRGGNTQNIQHNKLEMQRQAIFCQATASAGTETRLHLHGVDADTLTVAWSSLLANSGKQGSIEEAKELDYVAIPRGWSGRVPSNLPNQKTNAHWSLLTMLRKRGGNQQNATCTPQMEGWRFTTLNDEEACGTAVVSNMEMQMDAAGEIQLDDLGKMISSTAHAIQHERSGVNGRIQQSKEHFEAEKMLRRK